MIILRQKSFANFASLKHPHVRTQYKEDQKSPADANIMTNLGRTGLAVTGLIGGAGLVEGGRAVYNGAKTVKEGKQLLKEVKDPKVREALIGVTKAGGRAISSNGESMVENLIHTGASQYKGLKKSKIDRARIIANGWNRVSQLPRIVLLNSGDIAHKGVEYAIGKNPSMSKESQSIMRRVPKIVEYGGRSALRLKNSKGLLKAAGAVGGVSGLTYVNGRSLQNPNTNNGILTR
jgi:hypothetical protein